MTSDDSATAIRGRGKDIIINGKVWRPRHRIAKEDIGGSDKTLKRKHPKTVLINGMAYCPVDETLALLVAEARRPNTNDTAKKKSAAQSGAPRRPIRSRS
jgi:hypothetical protein